MITCGFKSNQLGVANVYVQVHVNTVVLIELDANAGVQFGLCFEGIGA